MVFRDSLGNYYLWSVGFNSQSAGALLHTSSVSPTQIYLRDMGPKVVKMICVYDWATGRGWATSKKGWYHQS